MSYRKRRLDITVATDASLTQVFADYEKVVGEQTNDNAVFNRVYQVGPADQELLIPSGITNAYSVTVLSDYPVRLRMNSSSGSQFTMKSAYVGLPNVYSAKPYSCVFTADMLVTSLYIAPISGSAQTANVAVLLTGDPSAPY